MVTNKIVSAHEAVILVATILFILILYYMNWIMRTTVYINVHYFKAKDIIFTFYKGDVYFYIHNIIIIILNYIYISLL